MEKSENVCGTHKKKERNGLRRLNDSLTLRKWNSDIFGALLYFY
jgi:hypothetical protein